MTHRTIRVGHEQTAREQARRTSPDFVAVPKPAPKESTKKPAPKKPAPEKAPAAKRPTKQPTVPPGHMLLDAGESRAVKRLLRQMGL